MAIQPLPAALPHDPLEESAPMALFWSQSLCHNVGVGGESCSAVHGFWQYLRLLQLVASPRHHAKFYRQALLPYIRRGFRRVLVSGVADFCMPAVVLWAYAQEGAEADVTVTDLCETPLRLSQWYAARTGTTLATVRADINELRIEPPFEIICTHCLFGEFSPGDRLRLLQSWHQLLVPGGVVVSVNPVRPGTRELVRFGDQQAREFRERVFDAASRYATGLTDAELDTLAARYLRHRVVYSLHSASELVTLFENAGFGIASLEITRTEDSERSAQGPTLVGALDYACFTAVRH